MQFPFDSPQKTKWSNLPSPMFQRNGMRLDDLTPPQRAAVMKLLTRALSADGYQKVVDIMHGDEVLKRNSGGRGGPAFGQDEYYLAYPRHAVDDHAVDAAVRRASSRDQPDDGRQPGDDDAEPAGGAAGDVHVGGRTVRPLGDENDKGFALINALDDEAARPGDPQLSRRRSRAGRQARTARRFSRKASARRR